MKFKIKKNEIDKTTKIMNEDSEKLSKNLDELLNQISLLEETWQGYDSKIFCDFAKSYINFLKIVPDTYSNISKVMNKANNTYSNLDKDYAETMKKAVVKHE